MDVGKTDVAPAKVKAFISIDMYGKDSFSQTLKLKDGLTSGRYYIYLSGKGVTPPSQPVEVWYLIESDKNTLVDAIYSSATESSHKDALFLDEENIYGDGKNYDSSDRLGLKNSLYKEVYDADISKILFNKKTQDYDTLKKNFNIAAAIAAFEVGEFGAWIGTDGVMTTKIWDDADPVMGNAQKHFNQTLSSVGRQNVINHLSGKEYATMEAFNKEFARSVIYNGVYNQSSSLIGYGHYYQLISELASVSEGNFATYLALGEIDRLNVGSKLLQSKSGNFDLMMQDLNSIINNLGGVSSENTHTGGGGSGGGGGAVNIGAYIPNVPVAPTEVSVFSDIDNVEWAKEAIEALKEKGIVSGTGDGKFEPNRAVKREEFIKMLVSALNIEVGPVDESFSDVDVNAWYAPYVSKAFELEITSGIDDNTFGIGRPIIREQCCAFIYRACADRNFDGEEKYFNDSSDVSDYAKESVKALSSAGIILGDENGNFNPKDNVTRAQTAVMNYRLISGGEA